MLTKKTIGILSAGALLAVSGAALASPPHWAPAHGYRAKHNVVVHKHVQPVQTRRVVVHHAPVVQRTVVHRYYQPPVQRTVVVHRPAPVYAAPAPVYAAPAPVYGAPNVLGTVVGGVIGAVIGSHVGGEMATGAGAVIGGVIGSGF